MNNPHFPYSIHVAEQRMFAHTFADLLNRYCRTNRVAMQLLKLNVFGYFKDSVRNITLRPSGKMSYTPIGKECELKEHTEIYSPKNRVVAKYGKILKKVLDQQVPRFKYEPKELEQLVNMIKAEVGDGEFITVKGSCIGLVYSGAYNLGNNIGTLNSCMQGKPSSWFDIYTYNSNVSMLIIMNDNNQLLGRAILWEIKGNIYMDRIYGNDYTIQRYINYAKSNNIIHKTYQSYDNWSEWTLPNGDSVNRTLTFKADTYHDNYPYVDTFACQYGNYLSNDFDGCYDEQFRYTDGTANGEDDENYGYCEISGEREHYDYLRWIETVGYYVCERYASYCDWSDESILNDDAVETIDGSIVYDGNNNLTRVTGGTNNEVTIGYAHIEDTFECEHDNLIYYKPNHEQVVIEELNNITVHIDNVANAYEDAGYVKRMSDENWITAEDMAIELEKAEKIKAEKVA